MPRAIKVSINIRQLKWAVLFFGGGRGDAIIYFPEHKISMKNTHFWTIQEYTMKKIKMISVL